MTLSEQIAILLAAGAVDDPRGAPAPAEPQAEYIAEHVVIWQHGGAYAVERGAVAGLGKRTTEYI